MNQKGFAPIIIILVVIFIILGGLYYLNSKKNSVEVQKPSNSDNYAKDLKAGLEKAFK